MAKSDALVVSLSDKAPPPRRFENEDGAGMTVYLKRKLTREKAQLMLKEVGKRKNRRTIVDFERLFGSNILKIEGVMLEDEDGNVTGPHTVTDRDQIVKIMTHVDPDIAADVEDFIYGSNHIGESSGNSSSGQPSPTSSESKNPDDAGSVP